MNFRNFSYQFHQETRKRIRELEKLYKQLSKSKNAVAFNKTCLNENILPKYSNIRTHGLAARGERFTLDYRKKFDLRQVLEKEANVTQILEAINKRQDELKVIVSNDDEFASIRAAIDEQYRRSLRTDKNIIIRKLNKLYDGTVLIPEEANCFLNLSNFELSVALKEVNDLGLNCHV